MEPKVKEIGFHYYSFSLKGNFWAATRGFFLNTRFCALSAEKMTWAALGREKMLSNKLARR